MKINLNEIKFDANGLVPCICQDINTKEVLMLAYMNEESLRLTIEKKCAVYYSRSRNELWEKGQTSGNTQSVKSLTYDCDKDSVLIKVEQTGNACHTGAYSCFFNTEFDESREKVEADDPKETRIIKALYKQILDRKENPQEGSYTNYLFEKGIDKILKKVGEEAAETIIAAKNNSKEELIYEASDLVYHMLVLLANQGVVLEEIETELQKRVK
ncbi:MAG: bifunctional phosphoribosyl-AMP cyclohydrolase/phosphoribosyl-ATP diphosphatase HisIE [Proteocatella sp.]